MKMDTTFNYQVYVPEWGEHSPEEGREIEASSPEQAAEKLVREHHEEDGYDDRSIIVIVKQFGTYKVHSYASIIYDSECMADFTENAPF